MRNRYFSFIKRVSFYINIHTALEVIKKVRKYYTMTNH